MNEKLIAVLDKAAELQEAIEEANTDAQMVLSIMKSATGFDVQVSFDKVDLKGFICTGRNGEFYVFRKAYKNINVIGLSQLKR